MNTPHKNICIITQSHLCRNPRVLKEAILLAENNYSVTIINSNYSAQLCQEDDDLIKPYNIKLLTAIKLQNGGGKSFFVRLMNKLGRWQVKRLKIQTPLALGYYSWGYQKLALHQKADLYICHQELGLYCGIKLLNKQKNVAFDIEDWYSQDLLPDAKSYRPLILLQGLEQQALCNGVFCITTSKIMAKQLAATYNSVEPTSIYNTFNTDPSVSDRSGQFHDPLKLLWFSQTIGPGRGLEDFITLTALLDQPLAIHLIGAVSGNYKQMLIDTLPAKHRLHFHDLIPNNELHHKIKEFDIGLALEPNAPPNKNYTISNKFFQYLQAGLPVIATGTAGQTEVFEKYQPGLLINLPAETKDIHHLNAWLNDIQAIKKASQAAQDAAIEYSWENESQKLLKLVEKALHE